MVTGRDFTPADSARSGLAETTIASRGHRMHPDFGRLAGDGTGRYGGMMAIPRSQSPGALAASFAHASLRHLESGDAMLHSQPSFR
jgi:hypothetical protein